MSYYNIIIIFNFASYQWRFTTTAFKNYIRRRKQHTVVFIKTNKKKLQKCNDKNALQIP